MRRLFSAVVVLALLIGLPVRCFAWGNEGHRLVALIAQQRLSKQARANVALLLGPNVTMADVASWADVFRGEYPTTAPWHYTDIPADQQTYDRDRDCPLPQGVRKGSDRDKFRDCAADRILEFEQRVADPTLDRTDRALALKFLIHFIGDQHQPMHATGVEKGANGIHVVVFGQATCGDRGGPCNLHAVWDSGLLDHRGIDEKTYLALLNREIRANRLTAGTTDPGAWTSDAKVLSDKALLPEGGQVDQAYYEQQITVVDRQIELAGLRLAAALNTALAKPIRYTPAPRPAFPPPPAQVQPAAAKPASQPANAG